MDTFYAVWTETNKHVKNELTSKTGKVRFKFNEALAINYFIFFNNHDFVVLPQFIWNKNLKAEAKGVL